MSRVPLFVRLFVFDFATTTAPLLLALQFTGDPEALLHSAAAGVAAAAVAAATKNLPGFRTFLAQELGVTE